MIPDTQEIEDAIVQRLRDVCVANGTLKSAVAIGDDEEVERYSGALPGAAVFCTDDGFDDPRTVGQPVRQEGRISWAVFVIGMGLREPRGGRKGALGAYSAKRAVIKALEGWEPLFGCPMWYNGSGIWSLDNRAKASYQLRFTHEAEIIQEL